MISFVKSIRSVGATTVPSAAVTPQEQWDKAIPTLNIVDIEMNAMVW